MQQCRQLRAKQFQVFKASWVSCHYCGCWQLETSEAAFWLSPDVRRGHSQEGLSRLRSKVSMKWAGHPQHLQCTCSAEGSSSPSDVNTNAAMPTATSKATPSVQGRLAIMKYSHGCWQLDTLCSTALHADCCLSLLQTLNPVKMMGMPSS